MKVEKQRTCLYLQIRNHIIILFLMIWGTSADFVNIPQNSTSQNILGSGLLLNLQGALPRQSKNK